MSQTARVRGRALVASLTSIAALLLAAMPSWSTPSPSSGTVSPAAPTLTYVGGPFDNTNATGVPPVPPAPAVSPVCAGTLSPCDDFALTVSIPPDSHTWSILINLNFANPEGDFDLYLIDGDGTTVDAASANTTGAQESVTFPVPHGSTPFTVRAVPYDVTTGSSGDTYTITVLLSQTDQLDPPDPPELPTVPGVPRFLNYHAPDGMGESAGEPSIGVNLATGKVMYQASLETLRVGFDDCASPAITTWEDKSAPTSQESLDAILFTDWRTNRTFVSQLVGACSASSFTDTDGDSYTPSQGCGVPAGADHQSYGGGPFAPGPNGPTTSYPNAVYYCSQSNAASICAMSQNGGLTFGPGVVAWNLTDCGAFHGHIKVASDGTAYVPNRSCNGEAGIVLTENNGLTWTVRHVTGSTPPKSAYLVDPSLGIGDLGRLYFGYQRSDGRAMIAVSDDKGLNWHNNQDVGAALGIKNSTFPEVVAGDNDRAAYAFLGTTTDGDYGDNLGFTALWHLYVATTYDGGVTWTTVDATPHDPVQRGSICNKGTLDCDNVPDDRNLLDFNDLTMDSEGRIIAAYADGCVTESCIHGAPDGHTPNDFTAKTAFARQSGGRGLLSQYDPVPVEPHAPGAPQLAGTRPAPGVVRLSWPTPDNGGAPITGYRIYRGTTSGGETFLNGTNAKNSWLDITANEGTAYYYRLTAVNASGESPYCSEILVPSDVVPPPEPCFGTGTRVATDASDAAPNVPPTPSVDIKSVSVSEPYLGQGANKLVFTLQVGESALPTPNSQWYILWNRIVPDASYDRNYVAMKTNAAGTPSFEYGKISPPNVNLPTRFGAADDGSYNAATGTIRITISDALLDGLQTGQTISTLQARTFFSRADGAPVSQNATSDYSPEGRYSLVGNEACRPNDPPTAAFTASPGEGCAPLTVVFDASLSSDPDGDAIATYQIDFGDGSPDAVQSSPIVTHVYPAGGEYGAHVHVTDARGKISQNVDVTVLDVEPLPVAASSGNATICFGGSAHLSGTGGESCSWSPAAGLSDPQSCTPTASPSETTTYTLTVTSEEGCASTNAAPVTVTVAPCAVAEIEGLRFVAGTRDTLTWSPQTNATSYRLYRGVLADLPGVLNGSADSCVRFEGSTTSTGPIIAETPAGVAGGLYWYLVDGLSGTTEGAAGNGSSGPRLLNAQGTCP